MSEDTNTETTLTPASKFMRTSELLGRYGWSDCTLYRKMKRGKGKNPYPQPRIRQRGKGAENLWAIEDVHAWEEEEAKLAAQAA